MELTKHNLRLLIFEDILHYHPECRSLIQSTLAAAAAATNGSRPSSTRIPSGVTGIETLPGNNAPHLPAATSGASFTPPAPRGVPSWPPNEGVVAPTGAFGGGGGWTGGGATNHSVTLSGVSGEAGRGGVRDVASSDEMVTAV